MRHSRRVKLIDTLVTGDLQELFKAGRRVLGAWCVWGWGWGQKIYVLGYTEGQLPHSQVDDHRDLTSQSRDQAWFKLGRQCIDTVTHYNCQQPFARDPKGQTHRLALGNWHEASEAKQTDCAEKRNFGMLPVCGEIYKPIERSDIFISVVIMFYLSIHKY